MDNVVKKYYYKSIVVDFVDYVGIHVAYTNPENPNDNNVRMDIPIELNYLQYYTKPNKESDIILSPLRKAKIDLPIQDSLDVSDLDNVRFLFYTKDVDSYNNSTFSTEKDTTFDFCIPDSEKLYILNKVMDMACTEALQRNYIGIDIPRISAISKYYAEDKEEEKKYKDPYIIIPILTHIDIFSKRDYCHEMIGKSEEIGMFLNHVKDIAYKFIQTQPQIPDDEYYSHIAVNVENPDDVRVYYCMTTGKYISRIIDISKFVEDTVMSILYKQVLSRKTTLRFVSRKKELLDMMRSSI
mgnify:CR=1 FL=1